MKGSDEKPKATKLKLTLNTDAKVIVLKRTKKVDGKAVKATVTKALDEGFLGDQADLEGGRQEAPARHLQGQGDRQELRRQERGDDRQAHDQEVTPSRSRSQVATSAS